MKKIVYIVLSVLFFSCRVSNYSKNVAVRFQKGEIQWQQDTLKSFILYFETSSFAAKHLEQLRSKISIDYDHVLRLIKANDYNETIHYFIIDNTSKMKALVGQSANGKAYPFSNTLVSVYSPGVSAVSPHELYHVISINLWGLSNEWIMEGAACHADSLWWNYPLHNVAAYLQKNNQLFPLAKLINHFRKYQQRISYPAAGSFIKFLYDKYGPDKFIKLWRTKDFEIAYSKSLNILETEWHSELLKYGTDGMKY